MLLQLQSISKSFGSVVVADKIDLSVEAGEALGIIGPNGAGKTSLFNLIAGGISPAAGAILLDGKDITRARPHERCIAGVGRSYQIPQPFENLTVFENLLVGAVYGRGKKERDVIDACGRILDLTHLLPRANVPAGSLTLLERKRLEMARALATGPRLLLLDEIAGGLTEGECQELVHTIKTIHAEGTTIVWIEHVVHALLAVVDRLVVLNFGRKIAEGHPRTVMNSPEVRQIYMGIDA
ncbi:ABC transporter ATP-binding protein [Pseudorhodoplanes sp.]|uniref:ABC transporter ATP-binding protein n=1 Tax=Pseudorhodoplanes sp. TaxID=1934341 RepID=UPI002C05EA99|nr:ABC transporter ATP-binding protein [Pseudorhodoplanes sp.]HWV51127.1 ABC transporter ATP-binding protein [Pseudorhodoplanes sp.]